MTGSLQEGFVICFFFLILKYIWYLHISRLKCNKHDRLVTNGTNVLCRLCFCVSKSLLIFSLLQSLLCGVEWVQTPVVPSYTQPCIVCSVLIQNQQGEFHKWDMERWWFILCLSFMPIRHFHFLQILKGAERF